MKEVARSPTTLRVSWFLEESLCQGQIQRVPDSGQEAWAGPLREVRAPGEVTLKKGLKGGVM